MKINKIDQLIAIRRICESYGAALDFRRCDYPIFITIPYAGLQTCEVVRSCVQELHSWCGVDLSVDGQKITVNL